MNITNLGNSVVFDDGIRKQSFPTGMVILTSSDDSKSVNVKGKASRRTLITFLCTDAGYETAEEAVSALSELL